MSYRDMFASLDVSRLSGVQRIANSGANYYMLPNTQPLGYRTSPNILQLTPNQRALLLDLSFNVTADDGVVSSLIIFLQDMKDWKPVVTVNETVVSDASGGQGNIFTPVPQLTIADCIESLSHGGSGASSEIVCFCKLPLMYVTLPGAQVKTMFEQVGTVISETYQASIRLDYVPLPQIL